MDKEVRILMWQYCTDIHVSDTACLRQSQSMETMGTRRPPCPLFLPIISTESLPAENLNCDYSDDNITDIEESISQSDIKSDGGQPDKTWSEHLVKLVLEILMWTGN